MQFLVYIIRPVVCILYRVLVVPGSKYIDYALKEKLGTSTKKNERKRKYVPHHARRTKIKKVYVPMNLELPITPRSVGSLVVLLGKLGEESHSRVRKKSLIHLIKE